MAGRKCVKSSKYVAKLADTTAPCAFCRRNVDKEATYGELYSIGDIHCHYFCVLLSCCLIQKGKDVEGLYGFMYPDILAEIERSKKHRCSYCGVEGATLGCSITQCKKQFHLPCGREKKAVSLYFGNYKSFCEKHAPQQKIPDVIMSKAKSRLARIRKGDRGKSKKTDCTEEPESVCVICYEAVDGFPTTETFWPPCCARDAWFHRSCLQRMALSAGMYYLKCPLCNDKDTFHTAVLEQGYFIPDRDAAWELDPNAFSGIYERPVDCRAVECKCNWGRKYDSNSGMWDIKLCVLCGGPGSHKGCLSTELYVCTVCSPAAPDQSHLAAIEAVSLPTQEQTTQRIPTGPVMPSRMSIRRTKPKPIDTPSSSSQNVPVKAEIDANAVKSNTDLSREELNLKTPRRSTTNIPTKQNLEDSLTPLKLLKQPENELLSPLKLLRQGLNEKISSSEVDKIILDHKIIEEMREKFRIPKPASVKRKIVGKILEGLLDYVTSEKNVEWQKSPEKIQEFPEDAAKNEDKENVLDITMNHCSDIQNEDLSLSMHISNTPEIILESSEQNDSKLEEQNILISINQVSEPKISETLEENILQPSILEQLIVCENANLTPKKAILEDDSSNNSSPFQLPPEFIAESSNSLPTIDTPKKLKKINIENDSMEISENNQIVNIDVVKIENSSLKDFKISEEKCAFKLSPLNKDIIKKNLDIDLESFKNQYLNEVDRKFNCKFDHNHDNLENSPKKIRSAIDFAMDALKKPPKRKLPVSDNVVSKKRKTTKMVRRTKKQNIVRTIDNECNKNGEKSDDKNVGDEKRRCKKRKVVKNKDKSDDNECNKDKSDDNECNVEKTRRKKKYKNNHKTELSFRNRNINLKIRFKSEELNLKISKPKKRGRISKNVTPKVLKQYVLQYPINKTSRQDCIARPDTDVTPMKRKYNVKREKSSDNLKQTFIANFFKVSPKA